ncbi:hypothetical protein FGO68_gene307 [Halteria grandinella]|uniref:Uncharacterized protein n=1 Tax=Halteria grandinella TaxID=5974 RepID=A0A8J8NVU5_HALGN|nr:hypothetical protein FGO68_gene307 [Halteria grandinella]
MRIIIRVKAYIVNNSGSSLSNYNQQLQTLNILKSQYAREPRNDNGITQPLLLRDLLQQRRRPFQLGRKRLPAEPLPSGGRLEHYCSHEEANYAGGRRSVPVNNFDAQDSLYQACQESAHQGQPL